MKLILEWLEDDEAEDWIGPALVGGMLSCLMLKVTFEQHGTHLTNIANIRTFASFVCILDVGY